MSEDKREAVNIGVTLSGQLITAALAMIAVIGTFGTFIIDKREVGVSYTLITGFAFIAFVGSIICGGKGINRARKDVFSSTWNLNTTKMPFNWQAILCLVGIFMFCISIFLGKQKPDDTKQDTSALRSAIVRLQWNDSLNRLAITSLKKKN